MLNNAGGLLKIDRKSLHNRSCVRDLSDVSRYNRIAYIES